jgi:hypothetical protein
VPQVRTEAGGTPVLGVCHRRHRQVGRRRVCAFRCWLTPLIGEQAAPPVALLKSRMSARSQWMPRGNATPNRPDLNLFLQPLLRFSVLLFRERPQVQPDQAVPSRRNLIGFKIETVIGFTPES